MANKRMFSKSVINNGSFLKMPDSAQALYFKISLNSDDDGYSDKYFTMQMTAGKDKDLQILIDNGFIYDFDGAVLLDLHWIKNNKIPSARRIASEYIDLQPPSTSCIQNVDKVYTQVSLDKVSLDKVSIGKVSLDKTVVGEPDKPTKKGKVTELPDGLNKEAWAEWRQHLKEKKSRPTPSALKKQLKLLLANKDDQKEIIEKAISSNWQGLFAIKDKKRVSQDAAPSLCINKGAQ